MILGINITPEQAGLLLDAVRDAVGRDMRMVIENGHQAPTPNLALDRLFAEITLAVTAAKRQGWLDQRADVAYRILMRLTGHTHARWIVPAAGGSQCDGIAAHPAGDDVEPAARGGVCQLDPAGVRGIERDVDRGAVRIRRIGRIGGGTVLIDPVDQEA